MEAQVFDHQKVCERVGEQVTKVLINPRLASLKCLIKSVQGTWSQFFIHVFRLAKTYWFGRRRKQKIGGINQNVKWVARGVC